MLCSKRARCCGTGPIRITKPLSELANARDRARHTRRAYRSTIREAEGIAPDPGRDWTQIAIGLIREVASGMKAQLDLTLAELEAAEFIYRQRGLIENDYIFKHALTQEVAYNSLLIERRKLLHEKVGQAMESKLDDKVGDQLSHVAHHYSRSDNVGKASNIWDERASRRYSAPRMLKRSKTFAPRSAWLSPCQIVPNASSKRPPYNWRSAFRFKR